jgi:hypothetical protein
MASGDGQWTGQSTHPSPVKPLERLVVKSHGLLTMYSQRADRRERGGIHQARCIDTVAGEPEAGSGERTTRREPNTGTGCWMVPVLVAKNKGTTKEQRRRHVAVAVAVPVIYRTGAPARRHEVAQTPKQTKKRQPLP